MKLLKKFSVLIMYAALSLSGLSAWAADSFVALATFNGDEVVPSVLSAFSGDLCLTISELETSGDLCRTISEPETSRQANDQTLAAARPRRPGLTLRFPRNRACDDVVENVRLYFGQRFANGQPILTLCDDDFKEDGCHVKIVGEDEVICTNPGPCNDPDPQCDPLDFDLNSVQFQSEQRGVDDSQINDLDGRLHDKDCEDTTDPFRRCGFLVIKDLIKRGLIYVVVNSDFKAMRADGTIRYKPPKGRLAVDGLLRGTLCAEDEDDEDVCPALDE